MVLGTTHLRVRFLDPSLLCGIFARVIQSRPSVRHTKRPLFRLNIDLPTARVILIVYHPRQISFTTTFQHFVLFHFGHAKYCLAVIQESEAAEQHFVSASTSQKSRSNRIGMHFIFMQLKYPSVERGEGLGWCRWNHKATLSIM